MDLQAMFDTYLNSNNKEMHKNLGTLTLKNILYGVQYMEDDLEVIIGDYDGKGSFEFGLDGNYCSYRGNYSDIALCTIYKGHLDYKPFTVGDLKDTVNKAIEEGTMVGYKGGNFPITEDTYVYISNEGINSGLVLSDITCEDNKIVLILKSNKL